MERKVIPVFEGTVNEAASKVAKKCDTIEKMLKELNTRSKKISTIKDEEKSGLGDWSEKFGELDEISLDLENLINRISKL